MKRLKLFGIAILSCAIIISITVFFYNRWAAGKLTDYIASLNVNPATGVIADCEERIFIPPEGVTAKRTAILLIHGYMSSPRDFGNLGKVLASLGYHVRAMRLPGHGENPIALSKITCDDYLNAVLLEYKALEKKFDRVILTGFSLGGTLASILASSEEPAGLLLLAPYFGVSYKWFYVLPPEVWNSLVAPIVPYVCRGEGWYNVNDPDAIDEYFTYDINPTAAVNVLSEIRNIATNPQLLRRITCPVMVIHSKADAVASPDKSHKAFSLLGSQDKNFVWLKLSNHIICLDYDKSKVIESAVKFIQNLK